MSHVVVYWIYYGGLATADKVIEAYIIVKLPRPVNEYISNHGHRKSWRLYRTMWVALVFKWQSVLSYCDFSMFRLDVD